MDMPLARKVEGNKFMWDGATYEEEDQARQTMEGYEKDGFEVRLFEEEGHYLVYSRRLATVQSAE
ncbi:MAG: hypothetical protein JRE29_03070 [Deltaproteobacteria bacterium]|nr:hypothetical protein [Deltaproteobacteria bacterium]